MADQSPSNINVARIGLNVDVTSDQVQSGELRYSLNAQVESFDGNSVTYQNEQGNDLCITFPEGFKVIGIKNIISADKTIFFLTNPQSLISEIGYTLDNTCIYNTLISDKDSIDKFNFSIDHPIHKVVVKVTNCSTQLYWTDGFNPRRYLDLDDLPWKETKDPYNDFKFVKQVGTLDSNKLLVQPNFSVPSIKGKEVTVGGKLKAGMYQFAIQYSNILGEGYTSYYNVTNPIGIFENKTSNNFDDITFRAITINIEGLDTTGLYEFFNIAVIKTINNISSVEKVGIFPISTTTYQYTYTGSDETAERLTITDIFEKFPYYDLADDIFDVNNVLGWDNLKESDEINYQPIWSKVKLQWETSKIPYNPFEAYNNGVNIENYRGYMRDEVYAFEGCFILANGKQTKSFHIPGRVSNSFDLEIQDWGKDNSFSNINECTDPVDKRRWEIYNTATTIDFTNEYKTKTTSDDCYVGSYQYGDFSYWESSDTYQNNPDIWGSLAGQPIRHHKFPDLLVSPIFDNNADSTRSFSKSFQHSIFPIGVKVDIGSIYSAIKESSLEEALKNQIIGFKITRGNRASNKSIIAKGIFHNVGRTQRLDLDNTTVLEERYYANYPYNDLTKDPFYANTKLVSHEGFNYNRSLNGFYDNIDSNTKDLTARSRFTFHSPDTHFDQPTLTNQGESIKLESIIYGKSYGKFVKVKDNAEYKFLTRNTIYAAAALAIDGGFTIGAGTFGSPTFSMASIPTTYFAATELFEKLVPYTNFGYYFSSVGLYGNYYSIPNDGFKIRGVNYNKYIIDGIERVEGDKEINNLHRESSVYINTNDSVHFPHEYSTTIPTDRSRYNAAILQQANVLPPYTVPQYTHIYTLNVPYIPTSFANGTITMGTVTYKVLYAFLSFDFANSGTLPNPYTGTIAITDLDPTKSVTPPSSGIGILHNNVGINNIIVKYDSMTDVLSVNPEYDPPDLTKKGLDKVRETNICSYYGSIRRFLPSQWGRLYSYETIDTGYYHTLFDSKGDIFTEIPPVYGGDIYINRFAYKSKMPFFTDNTIRQPNQTDIPYDDIGNLAYPMFWLSTKPSNFKIDINNEVEKLKNQLYDPSVGSILGNIVTGGGIGQSKAMALIRKVFSEIYDKIGVKNINLDQSYIEGIAEQGLMYLFAYGIPYYFCESEINVDYRQAYNEKEGNFYPNVAGFIPDDWFQEINVPIAFDNTYFYNQTFSKQNKENYFPHLREDYDPNKMCFTFFPNRAIWSDKSSLEETKNNWLIYRPAARFDLPKTYGNLMSIDNIEHNQLLVRYTDNAQVYNALTTVKTNTDLTAYLGNPDLFSGIALDLMKTDTGFAGSQNKILIKTEFGQVFIDSKRGQVILYNQGQVLDLCNKGMDKWFSENLPFKSGLNVDNHFNGLGLHGIYDPLYQRLIITKVDAEFSWTISYNFKTQSWVSYHSYIPNFYVAFSNYFQSGRNDLGTLWNHNKSFFKFQNFYGTQYPYILEYPYSYKYNDEILQGVKEYCSVRKQESFETYYEPDEIIYFNKSILYNDQQCSGLLKLIPKPTHNMSTLFVFPKYGTNSKDIVVSKSDNFFNYNTFWDISKDTNKSFFIASPDLRLTNKELKDTNLDYSQRDFKKGKIRGKNLRIRHILDDRSDVRLISRFLINNTMNSYK